MGILSLLTGRKSDSTAQLSNGGHNINANQVLTPTAPDVINPVNPGAWESIRTTPINHEPRYFTKQEADGLKQLATEQVEGARQSNRAYKSLKKIENADAQVHAAHRRYIRGVADSELVKKRSDVKTARHLHTLRPAYAKLGEGLKGADNRATARIDELKAKIQGQS